MDSRLQNLQYIKRLTINSHYSYTVYLQYIRLESLQISAVAISSYEQAFDNTLGVFMCRIDNASARQLISLQLPSIFNQYTVWTKTFVGFKFSLISCLPAIHKILPCIVNIINETSSINEIKYAQIFVILLS